MNHDASVATLSVEHALARHSLLANASDSPLFDCQLLLGYILGVERSWLYAHTDASLTRPQFEKFETLLAQRKQGVPVAYLVGHRSFWRMDLEVSQDTLIPRPETECLIEAALQRLPESEIVVVDAGTGTGAIAIAVAMDRPNWAVHAVDQSFAALKVAARNADHWIPGRVQFHEGNWLAGFDAASLDAILCNPPYIPEQDPHLAALWAEPVEALASGVDGLDDIRIVINQAADRLKPGGLLLMEHGYDQAETTRRLADDADLVDIETIKDFNGQPRVLAAYRPG